MIQTENTQFNFTFKADQNIYNFSVIAISREEALKILRGNLATIISDINEQIK